MLKECSVVNQCYLKVMVKRNLQKYGNLKDENLTLIERELTERKMRCKLEFNIWLLMGKE